MSLRLSWCLVRFSLDWLVVGSEFGGVVSAGFDAAAGDSLGMCDVTPACYAHMTALLSTLAGGRLVVALEASFQSCFAFRNPN